MATANAHGPESGRIHRLVRQMGEARERASRARWYGDETGAQIAQAEVRRIRQILAEG